jgi:hypothetical protein
VRDGGGDPIRGEEATVQECLHENAAHLSGAEHGNAERGPARICGLLCVD